MSTKLFSNDIPPSCEYCASCKEAAEGKQCLRKGAPLPAKPCRHYSYDPLKRVPLQPPELPVFKPEDFKL